MYKLFFSLSLVSLLPLPLSAIGFVYTGVGGGRRELMELTETRVEVTIEQRIAITRTDQIFTNLSTRVTEGIYEFKLPAGAIITDLVLWIDGKPVQGIIMEKEAARQVYDAVVRRRIDPALIEQIDEETFRLSIFPFPSLGSRRVELEYMQLLEAQDGRLRYTFPLASETDLRVLLKRFVLQAKINTPTPITVEVGGVPEQIVERAPPTDGGSVQLRIADEELIPEANLSLSFVQSIPARQPAVLSVAPDTDDEPGFYALWLPPLDALASTAPVARSLTFVLDISSSMQGARIEAAKAALVAAVNGLAADDLFNIVAFSNRAESFSPAPVTATPANRDAATAFVRRQGALGVTNFEAAFAAALTQDFPPGRANHTLFITDGHATIEEVDPLALSDIVADLAPGGTRIFTIGIGHAVNRPSLRILAEDYQGQSQFVVDEAGLSATLEALFAQFSRPVFVPSALEINGTQVLDQFPREPGLLAGGQEFFQVGRYRAGGEMDLSLTGTIQDRELHLEFPLRLAQTDTSVAIVPRLWAHRKVQAIEAQIDRYGPNDELLDAILQLGLRHRLVTRRTSLFAPDDNVVVNPEAAEEQRGNDGAATAVEEEEAARATFFGREFVRRDTVWVDVAYRQGMPEENYALGKGQPEELTTFARLGEDMLVVVEQRAYRIRRDLLPQSPVLAQNMPNPFNASTVLRYVLPASHAGRPLRMTIYNLAGQRVRRFAAEAPTAGENRLTWDGRDDKGRPAASGVYIYRLSGPDFAVSRRMLLLR